MPLFSRRSFAAAVILPVLLAAPACAQTEAQRQSARKPLYRIDLDLDYELLTFRGEARIRVPVAKGDPLADVILLLHANSIIADERRKNLSVDAVSSKGKALPYTLQGAVLRVQLPEMLTEPFDLAIVYRGVVPRQPDSEGMSLDGLLGPGLGELGGLLGASGTPQSKKQPDYGLYAYGNGVLSLGAFWYPQLAVRGEGKWTDSAAEGVGDAAFAEAGDFDVTLTLPAVVEVACSGDQRIVDGEMPNGRRKIRMQGRDFRDFAILMSEDYVRRSKAIDASDRTITVEAIVRKESAGQLDRAVDIAAHSVQIFSRRFGPYPFESFKVAEGPIRGGAGGMEFSGLVSISSMLFQDWGRQLGLALGGTGAGGLEELLSGLAGPGSKDTAGARSNPAAGILQSLLGGQMGMLNSLLEMTIAHEAAHQWWAMGVGNDSARSPFVDESLTNYAAILYFEDRYGKEAADRMLDLHLRTAYSAGRMLAGGDAPANLPTSAYSGNLQYAAVVYGKGALYYHALRGAVGDDIFFGSLREYYQRYKGRIAGPTSLLEIVQARAPGADVRALYRRWIEETHGDEDIGGTDITGIGDLIQKLLRPSGK